MKLERLTDYILKLRWVIILFTLIGTFFFGFKLNQLKIDADVIKSLPDDDPDALLLKEVANNFGSNSMGIVILETENIYDRQVLRHIKVLSDSLADIDGITSITSLTNIISISNTEEGFEVGQLVDEYNFPNTDKEILQLRNKVMSNDMYKGSIVSEDGTSTLIIFTIAQDAIVKEIAQEVIGKTESLQLPEKIYFAGTPMLVNYISDLMKGDLIRLLPFAFLLISIILFISFRSLSGIILPLLVAVISIIWSMGVMSLFNVNLSMISNNIPIIILAVGSAYAIHVINRVKQEHHSDSKKAIKKALQFIIIPVILAAVTTMIGFVSFVFGSYLNMISDFGIFTALGTFFACLFSLFLIPAILSFYRTSKQYTSDEKVYSKQTIMYGFLFGLKNLVLKHPKYILTIWSLLILISVIGMFSIERSVDVQDFFKKGNPAREAERILIEKFGGTKPIFVLFKGDVQSPELLQKMLDTQEYMEKSNDITSAQSIANIIEQLNYVVTGNQSIPENQAMIQQLWFLIDGNDMMQSFVNEDLTQAVMITKFKSPDNQSKKIFSDYMKEYIHQNSTEDCIIEITGMPFVDVTMDRSLINSQVSSILIAVFFAIIIVGLILRSLLNGLFAAIPIIVAILVLFGVMGLTGIPLNIATVLVASVALGIGIDYSIHVISHFNHSYKIHSNIDVAIEETILISGRAITINVLSVAIGFLILVFSEMVPLQYFGLLIALSMFGSSLGALSLLPVILILKNRNKTNI